MYNVILCAISLLGTKHINHEFEFAITIKTCVSSESRMSHNSLIAIATHSTARSTFAKALTSQPALPRNR